MVTIAADWVLPVSSPPLSRHAIDVSPDGRIHAVRPAASSDAVLRNVCLLPGLVNAHTHLAYSAMRNLFDHLPFFEWIRRLSEEKKGWSEQRIRASQRLGIVESLRCGITCVADLSDLEPALDVLSQSPLRGIFYMEVFGVEQVQADASWEYLKTHYPRLRSRYSGDRLDVGVSPHSCYTVRPELFRRVSDWAIENSVPISFHLAESRDEEEFVCNRSGAIADALRQRASDWQFLGRTSVAHAEKTGIFGARPLLAHLVQASPGDIDLLRSHDIAVAHCPKSNAKFAHGIAPLAALLSAGIPVGLGTDSAASNNRLDLFEEGRFALLQQRVRDQQARVTEEQILKMWTLSGARALGLHKKTGSLEAGKAADIIGIGIPPYRSSTEVVRHLVHNATPADLRLVMIGGKELDLAALIDESRELNDMLFGQ